VAAAIEAGMCFVNSQNVRDLRQPFGGTKASGTGREGGTWSYEVFLEPKNVCRQSGLAPHSALGASLMRAAARQGASMGKLALAAKITHVPSMYLSELDGPRKGTRQDAIDGHVEIGRRCRELGVDTIVVFDTHWLVNANYHVNCAPHFKGLYTSNELPHFISNMSYGFPGNPALGQLLAETANELGVETLAHDATTLAPEYGTLVPMRYMNADRTSRWSRCRRCAWRTTSTTARAWAGPCAARSRSTTTAPWPSWPAAR
jgi:hypothetical protein